MGRKAEAANKKLLRLLFEYLKDSNRSDRKIAKELGISQATVSRLKAKLLQDGIVTRFSAIPDLSKLGYEILVFSLVKFNKEAIMRQMPDLEKMSKEYAKSHPEILFDSRVEGMGIDAITISLHKNYASYTKFLAQSKITWGEFLSEVNYILVDLNGPMSKPFGFGDLVDQHNK